MHAGGIYSIISSREIVACLKLDPKFQTAKDRLKSVMHRALCLCINVLHIFEKSMKRFVVKIGISIRL